MASRDTLELDGCDARNSSLSTSRTLLERVRLRDSEAWRRFVHLYGPIIYGWIRRASLQPQDAADVTQDVFQAVSQNIARFRRDRPGDTFCGWLRTLTKNKVHDFFRNLPVDRAGRADLEELLCRLEFPTPTDGDHSDGAVQLAHRAMELIQTDFEQRTWQAFLRTAVVGLTAADTAAELGMTTAAVHKAKSRVLARLRHELDGLLE